MLIDLDRFKLVNDTLGHAVGDHLLKEVGQRLNKAVEGMARVGRLGGDEFAVIWSNLVERPRLAELADNLIAEISAPYVLGGVEVHIGATIGIASAPQDGESEDELTCGADLALYRAKGLGRGSHQFFEPWMREVAQSNRELESDLRRALSDHQLSVAYQPIVSAHSSELVGYEALLRWNHPLRGDIPPDLFVPIIEDAGLINEIGNWVVQQACAEAAILAGEEHIAINVSAAQLGGARLAAAVVAALRQSGLDPKRLELELTVSVFLGEDEATLGALASLRALGVRLVLDDFGKGYSSFGYLSRAHFAKIKVDQAFVRAAAVRVSPTYVPDLCHGLLDLLIDGGSGLWHLATPGSMSWYHFALRLAELAGVDSSRLTATSGDASDTSLISTRGTLLRPLDAALAEYCASFDTIEKSFEAASGVSNVRAEAFQVG